MYLDFLTLGNNYILNLNGLNLYVDGVQMVIGAYGSGWIIDDTVHSGGQTTVPASTTMLLFGTGLIGLTCNRRRRVPGDSLLNSNKRNARTNDALAKDRKKPRPLKCKFQEVDFKN